MVDVVLLCNLGSVTQRGLAAVGTGVLSIARGWYLSFVRHGAGRDTHGNKRVDGYLGPGRICLLQQGAGACEEG